MAEEPQGVTEEEEDDEYYDDEDEEFERRRRQKRKQNNRQKGRQKKQDTLEPEVVETGAERKNRSGGGNSGDQGYSPFYNEEGTKPEATGTKEEKKEEEYSGGWFKTVFWALAICGLFSAAGYYYSSVDWEKKRRELKELAETVQAPKSAQKQTPAKSARSKTQAPRKKETQRAGSGYPSNPGLYYQLAEGEEWRRILGARQGEAPRTLPRRTDVLGSGNVNLFFKKAGFWIHAEEVEVRNFCGDLMSVWIENVSGGIKARTDGLSEGWYIFSVDPSRDQALHYVFGVGERRDITADEPCRE